MSEIGEGGSEVSESTEVSEAPAAETGGEASEATQEAAAEEANETGGFHDADSTELPDDHFSENVEDMKTDDHKDRDDSQDVGFDDGEDTENTDSPSDNADLDHDRPSSDEECVGFDDFDVDNNPDKDAANGQDAAEADPEGDGDIDDGQDAYDDFDHEDAEEDPGEIEEYSEDDPKETEEQPEMKSEDAQRDKDDDASALEQPPEQAAETSETGQDIDKPEPIDDQYDELDNVEEDRDEGEAEKYEDDVNLPENAEQGNQEASAGEAPAEKNSLADQASKSIESPENDDAYRSALNNMSAYMNEHNYGPDDYAEYSKDPEWQKLNTDLQRSLGMEVTLETPDTVPSPESGKDVSATELSNHCVVVNASDIDMTCAQGMDSDQFWNHHGNTKEDYMRVAEKIPDVQQALDSGKSLDAIKQDPELRDTVCAYYDPDNMIKVEQQPDGSYSFMDDGRHRIAAAQECGYQIPVEVTNMPESTHAPVEGSQSDAAAQPEEATTEISDEIRGKLGAFEQSNWDSLSQVEREQAVEKLRDSIAEDLQLENKPGIAYYNNENSGDYGGYAASNNTIYINRFNMGDAAETADTIAHESRHCWQHERADHPQTEQDYLFKENFDDYIRPEDDFYEYQNQPVEADARDYAREIKEAIPETRDASESDSKQIEPERKDAGNRDAPPSETGPPEGSDEKTVYSD